MGGNNISSNKKNSTIGNIIFKDKILYGSEIIFDYTIETVKDTSLSEADIDSKAVSILTKLGWKEHTEIRQRKTNILEIDEYLKSKKIGSKRKGHADIYLLMDDKLKVIIDNKEPNKNIQEGIDDAIFYANCLLGKKYDIRIALSYNGKQCALRVFDSESNRWIPFLIDGEEIEAFPSKELVEIIYRYRDIKGIIIKKDDESINIDRIIQGLKDIYRNVPHIQNDNQKSMDFTISFIALKSILEKHGDDLNKNWIDLRVGEQKKLKEKIKMYVEDIIENLENGYEEIFRIKEDPKGKIKAFDFLEEINQFPNKPEHGGKGYLIQIFERLDELPHLHSSRIDPFGVVYQSLMDPHTRKIFGQFFTPRHLIKTLVRLFFEGEMDRLTGDIKDGKSEKPKTICDPACGTGGFLIESFKYFASNTADVDTVDLAKKSIYGFDIYPANAVRSRINMYLAGDGFSKIDSLDSFTGLKEDTLQFDYILTNPPFGKGDYCVDDDIISNKRKEINFLVKVIKLLKPHGKALIIVPDGILEAPTLAPLRKWVIENCEIEKIIGFPKHEFAPYTHEKTYVLFLKKRPETVTDFNDVKTERIWMYIIDADGYANSDNRFRTGKKNENGKWLHDELSLWRDKKGAYHISILEDNWKKKIQSPNEKYTDEWDVKIEGLKYEFVDLNTIFTEKYSFYQTLNKADILKMLQSEKNIIPPKKITEVLEEMENDSDEETEVTKELKTPFETILSSKNIVYDPYEDKFFNQKNPVVINLLNLKPEKYLRQKKSDTITFKQFIKENRTLFKNVHKNLPNIENIKSIKKMGKLNKTNIRDLFHIWQGHQITDKEIYNSKKGDIPIITGHNEIKGYTTNPYITDVPCITIPSKGIVNRLYLQSQPFDANNTIALIPKNRKEIDLEYFIFTQSDYITSFISSTSTNNYLNRALLEDIEVKYPKYSIQQQIKEEYKKLIKMKDILENNIGLLSDQLFKDVK
jgi:type I restriction-modification system DNA methylase subunit